MVDASAMTHLDKNDKAPVYAEYRAGDTTRRLRQTNPPMHLGAPRQTRAQTPGSDASSRQGVHRPLPRTQRQDDPYGSMESFFIKKLKE